MSTNHQLLHSVRTDDLTAYRPIPFWSWNDRLKPEELRRQIRQMKEVGMGGFFMHARGGLETEYLSEEWFAAVEASIDEAEQLGMNAWGYDENGWPSGFAGGKLCEDPANWVHYLEYAYRSAFDPEAMAVYVLEDNRLRRVMGQEDGISSYLCVYDRVNSSTVDALNPEITDRFLALTHEKYYERFSKDFGKTFWGFFTDEPQYYRPTTAYSPMMLTEYPKAYDGRDLLEELGALFADCEGAYGFRFRYWRLMNVLFTENFIARVHRWCQEHHCKLTGHAVEENQLFWQMRLCAGVMPFYEYEDIPGVDWLGREIATEMEPRQVSSVAQQLGKPQVLTETFACAGWDVTPAELKRIAEWQYVNGVNLMCHHLYPYSIRGQRKRDYPAFYSEHNPWTEELGNFNEYFSNLGYLLAQTKEQANVLVIHPLHGAYLTYLRSGPIDGETDADVFCDEDTVRDVNEAFKALIERLGAANIGHHYADERLLEKYGSVEGDRIRVGQCVYDCVIVPDMKTLDRSTAALLREYAAQGGRLLIDDSAPTLIDGEPADLSFLVSNTSFDELIAKESHFDRFDTSVRATFRTAGEDRFFYAVNLSDREAYDIVFSLPFGGAVSFDLLTKETAPVLFERTENGIRVPLTLAPGEAIVLFCEDSAAPAPAAPICDAIVPVPTEFSLPAPVKNRLTLDRAALSYDGLTYTDPMPIEYLSDRLLKERQNRAIWLKYTFRTDYLPLDLCLETESDHVCGIFLNGRSVSLQQNGTLDRSFLRGSIAPYVRPGENEIILLIDYQQSEHVYYVFNGYYYGHEEIKESLLNCLSYQTNIESIYLDGSFSVASDGGYGAPTNLIRTTSGDFTLQAPVDQLDLRDITANGFPFFSGSLTAETTVTLSDTSWQLRLSGRFQFARIYVNDVCAGLLLFDDCCDLRPYLHTGKNTLRIELMSSNRNLYGPFHLKGNPEPLAVSPDTFTGYGTWHGEQSNCYDPSYAFVRFGVDTMQLEHLPH